MPCDEASLKRCSQDRLTYQMQLPTYYYHEVHAELFTSHSTSRSDAIENNTTTE